MGFAPGWPGWLVLAIFLALFGKAHPAPYDAFTLRPPTAPSDTYAY